MAVTVKLRYPHSTLSLYQAGGCLKSTRYREEFLGPSIIMIWPQATGQEEFCPFPKVERVGIGENYLKKIFF